MKSIVLILLSCFNNWILIRADSVDLLLTNQSFNAKLYENNVLVNDSQTYLSNFSLNSNQNLILSKNLTKAPLDFFYMKIRSTNSFVLKIIGESRWIFNVMKDKCDNPYLLLNNSIYNQCINLLSNDVTTINASLGDSRAILGKNLMWWQYFDQLSIHLFGPTEVNIANVSLYGWPSTSKDCNCFPPGVKDISNPCDPQGKCLCKEEFQEPNNTNCMYSRSRQISPSYGPYNKALVGLPKSLSNISQVFVGNSGCSFTKPEICYRDGTSANSCRKTSKLADYNYCYVDNIDLSQIGISLPVKVCWEQICKLLDGGFYVAMRIPEYSGFNWNRTLMSGGLEVVMTGSNLNSVAFPILFLILCTKTTPPDCRYISSCCLGNQEKRVCNVNPSGSSMTCYSPPVPEDEIIKNFDFYYSLDDSTVTSFPGQNIEVCADPKISHMEQQEMDFDQKCYALYNNNNLLSCCRETDYTVMVGDEKTEICVINPNFISFRAPLTKPRGSSGYNNGTARVEVWVGELKEFVGNIRYDVPPDNKMILGVVFGSICALIILSVVILIACLKRKKMLFFKEPPPPPVKTLLDKLEEPLKSKVKRCLVDADGLEVGEEIGKGNFGKVYAGKFKGQQVAIKTLSDPDATYKHKKEFLEEAVRMMDFNHNNIVHLIAIVVIKNSPKVVLPLMKQGDLLDFLHKFEELITSMMMINMVRDVVAGMEYLAALSFVHRDLAARNCMVDEKMTVKIGDFGLARDIYHQYYYRVHSEIPLPYKWMAVECLGGKLESKFSEKTDVWSFGILMWEVFTKGDTPYFSMAHQNLKNYLISGKRLNKPPLATNSLYEIMLSCWREIPHNRPSFQTLKELLSSAEHDAINNIDHNIDNKTKINSLFPPRDLYLTPTGTN